MYGIQSTHLPGWKGSHTLTTRVVPTRRRQQTLAQGEDWGTAPGARAELHQIICHCVRRRVHVREQSYIKSSAIVYDASVSLPRNKPPGWHAGGGCLSTTLASHHANFPSGNWNCRSRNSQCCSNTINPHAASQGQSTPRHTISKSMSLPIFFATVAEFSCFKNGMLWYKYLKVGPFSHGILH